MLGRGTRWSSRRRAARGCATSQRRNGQVGRDAADLGRVERGREPVERLVSRRAARRSAWRSSGRSRSRSRRPRRRRPRRGSSRGSRSRSRRAGLRQERARILGVEPHLDGCAVRAAARRRAARLARSAAATARGRCPTPPPSPGAPPGCARSARGRRTRVPRARTRPCLRRRSRSRARSAPRRRVICARSVGVERGRRRLLEHLLVAALHRALALAEREHRAVRVGEQLDLDVPRALEVALEVDAVVAERRPAPRAAAAASASSSSSRRAHDAHAAPAAARGRLDDQRRLARLGHGRHARLGRDPLRLELVAAAPQRAGGGPTQVRPAASTASAKSPFSARKP